MNLIIKRFDELTNKEVYEILKSRCEVFMLEQRIICQDMDDVDYDSFHFFFEENGRVVAYLRAFYSDDDTMLIGRVLTLNHGQGIGRNLMNNALDYIRNNLRCAKIQIHSQKQAVGFYKKFGFKEISDEFIEEGVVHIMMEMSLNN